MNFDFFKIRPYDKSQQNGFEELVCQLAHLERPLNGDRFVRKEGAGGDAGVECYWILENDKEIAWQAKYFPEGMNPSKWKQLDKSFKTALEKHPKLTKYVVSLPLDKADSRRSTGKGKKVITVEDDWKTRVKRWAEFAKAKGRAIEFEYWGKHEITSFLTIDDPRYTGRALYWFNEPLMNSEIFKRIALKSRDSLGERYTPKYHVDLPIAKRLDGLGLNQRWWSDLTKVFSEFIKQRKYFFDSFLGKNKKVLDENKVKVLNELVSKLVDQMSIGVTTKEFDLIAQVEKEALSKISIFENELYDYENDPFRKHEGTRSTFRSFFSAFGEVEGFLLSLSTQSAKVKSSLVYGSPGIGKSHLLCDLSLRRIQEKLPTVFLLGAHYSDGNPMTFIKRSIDLSNYRDGQVLGALDAAGEACGARTMIILDAINEGKYRDEWYDQLHPFILELRAYPNICLLISCRTTYLRHVIPPELDESNLIRIQHNGFKGFEHRASEKYLSKQGISKPSAPILAPEFTNPLFLKTCCSALKSSGATAFPKGLRGITSLFDFYLESIESTLSRKKAYNPAEEIVRDSLIAIASELFPNNLDGIPAKQARKLINRLDPNPNKGDSFFDELMNEGVLSEDISYELSERGTPVIRFTYERFSDHFVAEQIIGEYSESTINTLFDEDQPLGGAVKEHYLYKFEGVLEALSILLAEKFRIELIDALPKTLKVQSYFLEQIFTRTVVWRSKDSFSNRTLELLNGLSGFGAPRKEILLKLSTEPAHPWNAELLHRNLIDKTLPERDAWWSTYVAQWDYEEDEEGTEETIVRTLIEWSYQGDIENAEQERVRLCAVVLFWFLTTSNRKVRDQSTKSLVRMLVSFPDLLCDLIDKFKYVDDLYLLERLYAVSYGVVCNVFDPNKQKSIVHKVYNEVFRGENPIPHILLRDYARGIMEFALKNKILPKDIDVKSFRPPYRSDWPLENPSKEELDRISGETMDSHIRSSLMGFPGDFGNYTLRCIHDWSPTPITASNPQTGIELKKLFAEQYLTGKVKKMFMTSITKKYRQGLENYSRELLSDWLTGDLEGVSDDLKRKQDELEKHKEILKKAVLEQLDDEGAEYFRWLDGVLDDRPAAFSRKWAQRWICKRAYDLGWTKDLFEKFERNCSYSRGGGHAPGFMERIGKKYQWIAFHEFLAHLSDNVHWIDRGYSDLEDSRYYGPWQIHKRDIDPTIWIRHNGEDSYWNQKNVWWQKFRFEFDGISEIQDKIEFLWSRSQMPDFTDLLIVENSTSKDKWTVLRGHWHQKQEKEVDEDIPSLDGWFRMVSIIINKKDYHTLAGALEGKHLSDPTMVRVPNTDYQTFLGEYPWHSSLQNISGLHEPDKRYSDVLNVKFLVPFAEYKWESGGTDYSLDDNLNFYLPAKQLVDELGLKRSLANLGAWENELGEIIFLDPSLEDEGVPFALMKTSILKSWLDKNDKEIIWLIGGEKMLLAPWGRSQYGRLNYSGMYRYTNGKVTGNMWFEEERPEEED